MYHFLLPDARCIRTLLAQERPWSARGPGDHQEHEEPVGGGVEAAARFAVAERLQDGCGDEKGRRDVGEQQGGRGVSGVAVEEMVRGGEA
jgi:hypothetical protein